MPQLTLHVWSDIACPWCYIGKRRLEAALAAFSRRAEVDVLTRSFELDIHAPRVRLPEMPYAQRLAAKYRCPVGQAEGMVAQMTETARGEGLEFRFDLIRPGNTFDAHRLLHFARRHGLDRALEERLFRGYLTEGAAIGDPAQLAGMAVDVGLDPAEIDALLTGDDHTEDVRADEAEAVARGIRAVPSFVIGEATLSGAQPAAALLRALESGA